MRVLLLLAMAYAEGIYDRCRVYNITGNACTALQSYDQMNYQALLTANGGYPILRDRNCENGKCLTRYFKNECELCDDDDCRRICMGKRSNTKELLEFLKEVIAAKYKYAAPTQLEVLNGAHTLTTTITTTSVQSAAPQTITETLKPPTATETASSQATARSSAANASAGCTGPGCQPTTNVAASIPAVVTITTSETKTLTVIERGPQNPHAYTTGAASPATAYAGCEDLKSTAPECVRVFRALEKKIQESVQINIQKAQSQKQSECVEGSPECSAHVPTSQGATKYKSKPSTCKGSSCRTDSPHGDKKELPTKKSTAGTENDSDTDSITTVYRVQNKTVTKDHPITLFREYTTTYTQEKPIINYKITTVTETATITKTSVISEDGETTTGSRSSHVNHKSTAMNPTTVSPRRREPSDASETTVASIASSIQPASTTTARCTGDQCPEKHITPLEQLLKRMCAIGECQMKLLDGIASSTVKQPILSTQVVTISPTETSTTPGITVLTVTTTAPCNTTTASGSPPTTIVTEMPTRTVTTGIPVTTEQSAQSTVQPSVIYRTRTVSTTIIATELPEPTVASSSALRTVRRKSTSSEPLDIPPITKTVRVPYYKTVTEEPEVETVYRTVTKKPRKAPKTASSIRNDESPLTKPRISLRCNMGMTNCKSSAHDSRVQQLGKLKTIFRTIYSVQKSNVPGEGDESEAAYTTIIRNGG